MESTNLAKAARELAEGGTPVFPLLPGEKKPLLGSHGYKDATTNLDEVEEYWRKTPQANIAVPTGRAHHPRGPLGSASQGDLGTSA